MGLIRSVGQVVFDDFVERLWAGGDVAIPIARWTKPIVVLTAFRAPLFYRMVTTGDPIDEELIALATRIALTAAGAGLLST